MDPSTITGILLAVGTVGFPVLSGIITDYVRKKADAASIDSTEGLLVTLTKVAARAIAQTDSSPPVIASKIVPGPNDRGAPVPVLVGEEKTDQVDTTPVKADLGDIVATAERKSTIDLIASTTDTSRDLVEIAIKDQKSAASQQRAYFILSVIAATVGVSLVLIGAYLLLTDRTTSGTLTAVASAVPGVISALVYKRADVAEKRRDRSAERAYKSMERGLSIVRTLQVVSKLTSTTERERVLRVLAMTQAFPDTPPKDLMILLGSPHNLPSVEQQEGVSQPP